jgi:peptidylprolyl isomerase
MAVVDTIVANTLAKEPTEAELVSFYESHQAVFTTPAQVRVQQISFSGNGALGKALAQAEKASAAISHGMDFTEARERYGDGNSVPVPDTPLPLPVLQRQLGPMLTSRIQTMKAGDISPPLQSPSGYLIVRLVEWQPEQIRPYQTVSQEVKAEYLRRKRDEALQHYLDSLRQEATVVLSPKAPG